jgi:hypothetical protein
MCKMTRQTPFGLSIHTIKNEEQESKTGSFCGKYQWEGESIRKG